MLEIGVDVAEQSRVTDAAVGPQSYPSGERVGLAAGHAVPGIIDKSAAVTDVVRGPRLAVVTGKVLAVLDELEDSLPVHVLLGDTGFARLEISRVVQGFQRRQRVVHVGVGVFVAVSDSSVER